MYLFDDYPVTEHDVKLWLDSIKTLSPAPFRREAYRKAYRVKDKIQSAKRNGNWPPISQQIYWD